MYGMGTFLSHFALTKSAAPAWKFEILYIVRRYLKPEQSGDMPRWRPEEEEDEVTSPKIVDNGYGGGSIPCYIRTWTKDAKWLEMKWVRKLQHILYFSLWSSQLFYSSDGNKGSLIGRIIHVNFFGVFATFRIIDFCLNEFSFISIDYAPDFYTHI